MDDPEAMMIRRQMTDRKNFMHTIYNMQHPGKTTLHYGGNDDDDDDYPAAQRCMVYE